MEAIGAPGRAGGASRTVVAVNAAIALLVAVPFVRALVREGAPPLVDFPALYTGWYLVAREGAHGLYDPLVQGAVQAALGVGQHYVGGVLPFLHPPHAALALSPLGLLSLEGAYAVWMAIQLGAAALVAVRLRALLPAAGPGHLAAVRTAFVALPPVWMGLFLGQVSLLLLLALVEIAAAAGRPGRALGPALALLVISIKPQLLPLPLALVALTAGPRAVLVFAGLAGAAAAVTTLALGPEAWAAWAALGRRVAGSFGVGGFLPAFMNNLRGVLTAALGHGRGGAINAAAGVALLGGVALYAVLARRGLAGAPARRSLALAGGCWLAAFLSPHLYLQDEGVYFLAALLAGRSLEEAGRSHPWLPAAALPAAYVVAEGLFEREITLGGARPSLLVVLALGAFLMWVREAHRRPGHSEAPR